MYEIDWIQGEKFKSVADFLYSPKDKKEGDYDNLVNNLDFEKVCDHNIIYTHTLYAKQLFSEIKSLNKKVVIVTHNSDVNVDSSFVLPANVIKWYTTNVNIVDNRIVSIPIGIENNMWHGRKKQNLMIRKLRERRKYKNMVYMNHNINTNPGKRLKPYQILGNKEWVTVEKGSNWHDFGGYIDNIYNHKFVICPEGNGIDTHRIWETLYMGSIPIVENNINNSFYDGQPMVLINDWEELLSSDLNVWYNLYSALPKKPEILTFEYWKNKIQATA